VQVLLGIEHTIFKIDGYADEYKQLMQFINLNFNAKNIKENILFIPMSIDDNHKRKFLMKWLYSYYKKNSTNFKPELKNELIKRINKPVHIHFLAKENQLVTISATFYDNAICQLVLDSKENSCNYYILQYFSGYIRLKSLTFNLYELKIESKEHKKALLEFFKKKRLGDIEVRMHFNKKALELFLDMIEEPKELSEIEKACSILKVKKSDSLNSIKKHYRKLAKTYHPDLSSLDINESTQRFQMISDAFDIIKRYKTAA